MGFKEMALKAEEEFDFIKALEYYEQALDELCVEDGSLQRYANLLLEFQHYEKAKKIFEILVQKTGEKQYIEKLSQIHEELGLIGSISLSNEPESSSATQTLKPDRSNMPFIQKFLELFSGRENVFAVQTNTGYYPVRLPIKEKDVIEHLEGSKTIGVYPLRSDNNVKFAAIDIDLKESDLKDHHKFLACQETTKRICENLKAHGIEHYVEYSGNRGYHIWIFFDTWIQSYKVRLVLKKVISDVPVPDCVGVEIFPKQSDAGGGLGSLIKLPLGIHRRTSKRCPFVDENFEPIQDQLEYLLKIKCNPIDTFEKLYRQLSDREAERTHTKKPKPIQKSVKKTIRREIEHSKNSDTFKSVVQLCHVLNQIVEKIQKQAYISEDEEHILIATLGILEESKNYLTELLQNNINYSPQRLEAELNRLSSVPLSCEEIREHITSRSLTLNLDRCNCNFKTALNSPLGLTENCVSSLLDRIDLKDLIKKILDKTQKKTELENQIKSLKALLALKMSGNEMRIGNFVVKKNDGEVQIIF